MAATVYWLLNTLVIGAFFASLILWVRLLWRCKSGLQLLDVVPVETRSRPFWSPADFLIMFGMMLVLAVLFGSLFSEAGFATSSGDPDAEPTVEVLVTGLLLNSAAGLGGMIAVLAWLKLTFSSRFSELSLHPRTSDIKLGLLASVYLLPPVMLIAAGVSYFVPYEHKVLETLTHSPTLPLFVLLFLGTAILTPLIEEFMFRVLLQGGMQGMVDRDEEDGTWMPTTYWPIVFTSIFFALMHFGQGAAPIPLFFLSLGLGYLYRQTGRIWAPLMVHIVLNALTLCVEFSRTQI